MTTPADISASAASELMRRHDDIVALEKVFSVDKETLDSLEMADEMIKNVAYNALYKLQRATGGQLDQRRTERLRDVGPADGEDAIGEELEVQAALVKNVRALSAPFAALATDPVNQQRLERIRNALKVAESAAMADAAASDTLLEQAEEIRKRIRFARNCIDSGGYPVDRKMPEAFDPDGPVEQFTTNPATGGARALQGEGVVKGAAQLPKGFQNEGHAMNRFKRFGYHLKMGKLGGLRYAFRNEPPRPVAKECFETSNRLRYQAARLKANGRLNETVSEAGQDLDAATRASLERRMMPVADALDGASDAFAYIMVGKDNADRLNQQRIARERLQAARAKLKDALKDSASAAVRSVLTSIDTEVDALVTAALQTVEKPALGGTLEPATATRPRPTNPGRLGPAVMRQASQLSMRTGGSAAFKPATVRRRSYRQLPINPDLEATLKTMRALRREAAALRENNYSAMAERTPEMLETHQLSENGRRMVPHEREAADSLDAAAQALQDALLDEDGADRVNALRNARARLRAAQRTLRTGVGEVAESGEHELARRAILGKLKDFDSDVAGAAVQHVASTVEAIQTSSHATRPKPRELGLLAQHRQLQIMTRAKVAAEQAAKRAKQQAPASAGPTTSRSTAASAGASDRDPRENRFERARKGNRFAKTSPSSRFAGSGSSRFGGASSTPAPSRQGAPTPSDGRPRLHSTGPTKRGRKPGPGGHRNTQ